MAKCHTKYIKSVSQRKPKNKRKDKKKGKFDPSACAYDFTKAVFMVK